MLSCGYEYLTAKQRKKYEALSSIEGKYPVYLKKFSTSEGIFTIALELNYDVYTILPWAHIISKPLQFDDMLLPHVNNSGNLCYVEQMEADWNPNDLVNLYRTIDHQIQRTLDNSVESLKNGKVDQVELEGEFVAYWKAERLTYALTNLNSLNCEVAYLTLNTTNKDGSKRTESLLFGLQDKDIQEKWLSQRLLEETYCRKLNVFCLTVRPIDLPSFLVFIGHRKMPRLYFNGCLK